MDGDSFNPIQNPIIAKPMQITGKDRAKPSIIQVIVSGMVTIAMVFRRPILSQTGPLSKLPIGWAMCAKPAANIGSRNLNRSNHICSSNRYFVWEIWFYFLIGRPNKKTYTATTFERHLYSNFHLDSIPSIPQSVMEWQLTGMRRILPDWKWSNFLQQSPEPENRHFKRRNWIRIDQMHFGVGFWITWGRILRNVLTCWIPSLFSIF